MENFEVPFKQVKMLKDLQLKLESEGFLKVHLPNKVEWKVTKPQPLELTLEENRITIRSDGKVDKFDASEGSVKDQKGFRDLLDWLRLDADGLLKNYKVTQLGPNRYKFESLNPGIGMKALTMSLGKSGHVSSLSFEELGGDEILISFGHPKVKYRKQP